MRPFFVVDDETPRSSKSSRNGLRGPDICMWNSLWSLYTTDILFNSEINSTTLVSSPYIFHRLPNGKWSWPHRDFSTQWAAHFTGFVIVLCGKGGWAPPPLSLSSSGTTRQVHDAGHSMHLYRLSVALWVRPLLYMSVTLPCVCIIIRPQWDETNHAILSSTCTIDKLRAVD